MLDEKDKINERGQQSSSGDGKEGRASQGGVDVPEAPEGNREESGRNAVGQIYFIETEDGRFVKIGYSVQPTVRMSQLGTLRPGAFKLRLLGFMPGSRATERWMHEKFAADRDNGEWFRDSPSLRTFIETLGLIQPVVPETLQKEPEFRPAKPNAMKKSKNPAAVALGRRGGQVQVAKGTAMLSPEERRERGKLAAAARWAKKKKQA